MRHWIFKISNQRSYGDVDGVRYEYDNRHSVRVQAGDLVYPDKRGGYRFTGAGTVSAVEVRSPTTAESARGKTVGAIYGGAPRGRELV